MKITRKLFGLSVAALSFAILTSSVSAFAAQAEKEWTFLLFLNGHNNLSSFGDMNLKDMEKSGSTDQVNMVVEWGKADDQMTHRLLVQKSNDPSKVTSPFLMSRPNVDMGDYKNLVDFVKWGVQEFPARHYFVAVWNHGSGWQRLQADGMFHANDISYDDNTGNHITTEQLGVAMAEIKQYIGRNVDIYGSDACLMSMAEVATEMKDSVDYFVGSEEVEPGEGWPYAPFMKAWTSRPTMTPAEVSITLSKEYVKAYSKGGVYSQNDVTFSAMDLSKLDAVLTSTKALSTHLASLPKASLKKIKTEVSKTQNFYYSDNVDYGDFLKHIEKLQLRSSEKLISEAQSSINNLVISVDSTSMYKAATGVAIWIPSYSSSSMTRYDGLKFSAETGWNNFLKKLLAAQ